MSIMETLKIIIEKSNDFYNAYAENCEGVYGAGDTVEIAKANGALGVNVAHSGTVVGLLFESTLAVDWNKCRQEILALNNEFTYLGVVDLVDGGIK